MLLFLNISGGELMVIFIMILMLFGAKSIPTIARTLGRGMRQIKDATNEIQRDIRESANSVEQEVKQGNVVNEFKKTVESEPKPKSTEE